VKCGESHDAFCPKGGELQPDDSMINGISNAENESCAVSTVNKFNRAVVTQK
jgi:hypothetical protein